MTITRKATGALLIGAIIGSLLSTSCRPGRDKVVTRMSFKPAFTQFAELDMLYSIDIADISMFGKESSTDFDRALAFDSRHNLYILDTYECRITVFDEHGKYVRSFGRAGQGPEELTSPHRLVIGNDKIYVFEGFTGLKVLSLEGRYIAKGVVNIENLLKLRAIRNNFYLFRGITDPTFTKLEFLLLRADESFAGGSELFRYAYPPGLQGPNYDFGWHDWLMIAKDGSFFFPEDNFGRYEITKFGPSGSPELRFGRDYRVRGYSEQARSRFLSLYEEQVQRGDREFPASPPIVGNMFQDEKKNVWVIVGESSEDNGDPQFENTVDVFSENGRWLAAMKSKAVSRFCHYHNGKVYLIPSSEEESPAIRVFGIRYLVPR
jgi:6-bladed beta-propeller